MRLSLLVTVIVLVQQAGGQSPRLAQNYWTLLPNVLVVEVDGSSTVRHPLTCLDPSERGEGRSEARDGDMVWMRDDGGGWVEEEAERGNTYEVVLEETVGGGNYSCHSPGGALLNHTVLLVKEQAANKILLKSDTDYLKCSTQNYSGEFRCSWEWHPKRVGEVVLVRAARGGADDGSCSVDESGQQWTCSSAKGGVSCWLDGTGHGISCLDRTHCLFVEEAERIALTVYLRNDYYVEEYKHSFYLSEIVKPDRVIFQKVNESCVEWSYPGSWNTPRSFFPLTFQVREVKPGCTCDTPCTQRDKTHTTERNQWSVRRRVVLCVRAQDALCNSHWSDWSQYRKKRKHPERKGKRVSQ